MKTTIKVLGTGCPKCKTVTAIVQEVINEHQIDAEVIKIEDIMEIMEYNVLSTPALIVNDKVVAKGRVPKKEEVLEWVNA